MTRIESHPGIVPERSIARATSVGAASRRDSASGDGSIAATRRSHGITGMTAVLVALLALLAATSAPAQETTPRVAEADGAETAEAAAGDSAETTETPAEPVAAATPDQPKTMSGMSILGNEEAPKALVIVPWKSSELGDELGMSENLDDRALPVDKEVFMRKLQFYEIRKEE